VKEPAHASGRRSVPLGMTTYSLLDSPLGEVLLTAGDDGALTRVMIGARAADGWRRHDAALAGARGQLTAYFAGELRAFDLPLALGGTPWQQRVWAAVGAIPYGETRTYGELAAEVCTPAAARAVGHANGRNPACIVVPCHRVVGARGALTGYAYGVERKRALLDLERGAPVRLDSAHG
jgi:methylated-DNA-[protein]-cysteine S-methyltransferase